MLEAAQKAAWIAAFAFLVTFFVLLVVRASTSPRASEQSQNQRQPNAQNENSGPQMTSPSRKEKGDYWARAKQHAKNGWNNFVDGVEKNDKVVIALSGIAVAVFTGFLVVATILLFISGEKTADAAKVSADAARRNIDMLVVTQRASISVGRIVSDLVANNGQPVGWALSIEWQNKGPTRTGNFRVWLSIKRFEPDILDSFDFAPANIGVETAAGTFEGNSAVQSSAVFLGLPDIELAMQNNGRIYIWGKATYNDIFSGTPEHHTEFCVRVDVIGNVRQIGIPFEYTVYKKHNSAD